MKRQLAFLGVLPLLWLAAGCTPQEYYRETHYQNRYRPYSYRQPQAPRRYQGDQGQTGQHRVPSHAVRKYRRYVARCQRTIKKCRYRTRVIKRAIRRVRRSMYYQRDPYHFDQSRARLQFYYQNIRKYHRCVSVYSYRMRWARAHFQRRYGIDPKHLRHKKKRFAQPPRRYARRWAQPPPGDLWAQRRRRYYHRDDNRGQQHDHNMITPKPRVTPPPAVRPTIPRVTPQPTPPAVRQQPSPVAPVKPDVEPVKPDLRPAPKVEPKPTTPSPSMPNTAQVRRWMQFCMAERRKNPMQVKLRYQRRSSLRYGKFQWDSRTYAHNEIAGIQPLPSSLGRYVVLGADGRYSQAHCEDRTFRVWDSKAHRAIKLRPPVTAFLLRNTHFLPWFAGKKHAAVEEQLLFYRPDLQRAGLMIKAAFPAMKGRSRFLYLVWDLQSNRISHAWTLGQPGCHSAYRPVGVTPDGQTLYYLRNDLGVAVKCDPVSRSVAKANGHRYAQKLMALNLNSGARRMVSRFANSRKRFDTYLPNRDYSKVAVIEYAEMATKRGKVFLIDTRSGRVKRFAAPLTPYGVVFSADQRSLLIYNSKQGQLVRIVLSNGQKTTQKVHRLGHAMGLSKNGRHVYLVYHGGVEVRDAKSLKRIEYLPHRKMMGNVKFIHVGGSKVSGGVLFVKNGEKLFIQKLSTTAKSAPKAKSLKNLRNQIHGIAPPAAQPKKAAPKPAPRQRKQPAPTRPAVPYNPNQQYIEY